MDWESMHVLLSCSKGSLAPSGALLEPSYLGIAFESISININQSTAGGFCEVTEQHSMKLAA
jgi:hypothetical protein